MTRPQCCSSLPGPGAARWALTAVWPCPAAHLGLTSDVAGFSEEWHPALKGSHWALSRMPAVCTLRSQASAPWEA